MSNEKLNKNIDELISLHKEKLGILEKTLKSLETEYKDTLKEIKRLNRLKNKYISL